MKNFLICFLLFICGAANAFSVEHIVAQTKGKVSAAQATKIVSAVYKYSMVYDIDPNIIFRIMQVESMYRVRAKPANGNSTGLMQVIPRWHRDKIKGRDLFNIDVNVEVGTRIFKDCLTRTNGNTRAALWCYNASSKKKQYAQKVLSVQENVLVADNFIRLDKVSMICNQFMKCRERAG